MLLYIFTIIYHSDLFWFHYDRIKEWIVESFNFSDTRWQEIDKYGVDYLRDHVQIMIRSWKQVFMQHTVGKWNSKSMKEKCIWDYYTIFYGTKNFHHGLVERSEEVEIQTLTCHHILCMDTIHTMRFSHISFHSRTLSQPRILRRLLSVWRKESFEPIFFHSTLGLLKTR